MGSKARDEDSALVGAALVQLGASGPFGELPPGFAMPDLRGLGSRIVWVPEGAGVAEAIDLGKRSAVRKVVRSAAVSAGLGDPWADRRAKRAGHWRRAILLVGAIAGAVAATALTMVTAGAAAPIAGVSWAAVAAVATAVSAGAAVAAEGAGAAADGEDVTDAVLTAVEEETSTVTASWVDTVWGRWSRGDVNGATRAAQVAVQVRGRATAREDFRGWCARNGVAV